MSQVMKHVIKVDKHVKIFKVQVSIQKSSSPYDIESQTLFNACLDSN